MYPLIAIPGHRAPAGRVHRLDVVWGGARYLSGVQRAGGIACVLDPTDITADDADALIGRFDGLLVMGGADVNAARYGAEPHPTNDSPDNELDQFEAALLHAAFRRKIPVLAICRGFQLLNVELGGTLQQHLGDRSDVMQHAMPGFPAPAPGSIGHLHQVSIAPNSLLSRTVGSTDMIGASSHHQALDVIADRLVVTARTDDGIPEAVEWSDPADCSWLIAVQWHPEDTAADDAANQALFDAFVAACGR
jgi:putative glutamine amidotransferase